LLALVPEKCEVADLVERDGCGLRVDPSNVAGVASAIERFLGDPALLAGCKARARATAVRDYGRGNTSRYVDALRTLVGGGAE
jgi:glycosyltransferase involved in cell wall biosynthesis